MPRNQDPVEVRDEWIASKISLINPDFADFDEAREYIIMGLQQAKFVYTGHTARPGAASRQSEYIKMQRLLETGKSIPAALAESVRLLYDHEAFPDYLVDSLESKGWHVEKITNPFLSDRDRRTTTYKKRHHVKHDRSSRKGKDEEDASNLLQSIPQWNQGHNKKEKRRKKSKDKSNKKKQSEKGISSLKASSSRHLNRHERKSRVSKRPHKKKRSGLHDVERHSASKNKHKRPGGSHTHDSAREKFRLLSAPMVLRSGRSRSKRSQTFQAKIPQGESADDAILIDSDGSISDDDDDDDQIENFLAGSEGPDGNDYLDDDGLSDDSEHFDIKSSPEGSDDGNDNADTIQVISSRHIRWL
ncbi:hypothetical protein QBC46DRAFT_341776 [Diplogelasinospora grovesii]|uniref:Uncharacterized protein n=1 Tax=Diplogelasinospora grovesii TaxID=303347 RepID=A0AAN6S4Z9_9PEZI|nr:hypothetical protein QBC46DRAFT_341776 [Diplogelasinospora grovesii]